MYCVVGRTLPLVQVAASVRHAPDRSMTVGPRSQSAEPSPTGDRHAWLPYAALVVTMVIYAFAVIVSRDIRDDIPPAGLTFWRFLAAFVILLPFVYRQCREQWSATLRMWRHIVAIAVIQTVIGQVLFYVGVQTTTATNAGLIIAVQPTLVIFFAWLLLGDVMTRRQGIGLILAIFGATAIVIRGDVEVLRQLDFVIGDFWILISIVCWGYYSILVRQCSVALSPLVIFETMSFVSVVALIPVYGAEMLIWDEYVSFNLITVSAVLFFAVFASIFGLSFLMYAISTIGPGRTAMFSYLIPPFTAIAAYFLLDELFEDYHLVGMILILLGVYLASRRRAPVRGTP